jgi:zinc transporter 5/7
VLIKYTGLPIFDPIASLLIAGLIIASVIPLIISSARTLSLELEAERVNEIRNALAEVSNVFQRCSYFGLFELPQMSNLEGVESYGAARFWPKDEETIIGSVHIQLAPSRSATNMALGQDTARADSSVIYSDPDETRERVEKLLYKRIDGLEDLHVQIEAGDATFCTCRT